MTRTPTVSVIIPARNAEATLAETLDSLLAQTFPDWEAIIVDDASSDRTEAVARGYASRDSRFRIMNARAGRAGIARNAGLAAAAGRRLLFLDADDWIASEHLATLNAALDAEPDRQAAYCAYQRVTLGGGFYPAQYNPLLEADPVAACARRCPTAIHAVLMDRETVEALGGFDPDLVTCEDWDLWLRAAQAGARFVGAPEALAFYRTGPVTLSRDSVQMVRDARRVIARGFRPDSSTGADEEDGGPGWWLGLFALWCAASDVGAGKRTISPDLFPDPVMVGSRLEEVAATVLDGLTVGAGRLTHELAAGWPRLQPELSGVLQRLETTPGSAGLARRLLFAIEQPVLDSTDLGGGVVQLALIAAARVDLTEARSVPLAPSVELLTTHLFVDGAYLGTRVGPVDGPVSREQLGRWALRGLLDAPDARRASRRRWSRLYLLTCRAAGVRPDRVAASLLASRGRHGFRRRLVDAALVALSEAETSDDRLRRRLRTEDAAARREAGPALVLQPPPADRGEGDRGEDREAFWEAVFAEPDPWNYSSDYERRKYERTLSLLPSPAPARALELACAEGLFTEMLSPHVGRLLAADISTRALSRAETRCAERPNVEFRQLDLTRDPLPGNQDLVVCSEVLYYLRDREELSAVSGRLAGALAPNGVLITAHAYVLADDMGRTGFDWENPFGARTISRTLASTPGLAWERSLRTDLYQVDCFRKTDHPAKPEPVIETCALDSVLEPEVARYVVWGGARVRRTDALRTERTARVPVLMYHRVADDGPPGLARYRTSPAAFDAQMQWLRQEGYHAITSSDLVRIVESGEAAAGRPVLITFDDGTQDFATTAWPMLRKWDFSGEVFVVTDRVGGAADWDRAYGFPAPLMTWEEIGAAAAEGAQVGSHLATHRHADALDLTSLAGELARSRATLEAKLGREVTALAAPFGRLDPRLPWLAREAGYRAVFGTRSGKVDIGGDLFDVPRIEVRGDWTTTDFANALRGTP